jgi:hypothetical protein
MSAPVIRSPSSTMRARTTWAPVMFSMAKPMWCVVA